MATRNEVRDRAANDLGLLMLGQSLQAQDSTRILAGYDEVYASLKKDGLATWASTAEVPDEVVPYMVTLVAHNCLNVYGVSVERYNRIMLLAGTNGEVARGEIRRLVKPDYVSMDDPTDY